MALSGPILLLADDLHWADPESVEALLWLLRRASGDRVLVAVGSRPLPPEVHTGWQRWIADHPEATTIALAGLTRAQVAEVARRRWPGLTDDLAGRLYEHTGGNPLYLTTLLAENDLAELSTTALLPAPAAFARSIALGTAQISPDALLLLRATCVLDSGWSPLGLSSAVAGIDDAGAVTQELIETGLLERRGLDGPTQVRPPHALVRAAVYQQTPLPQLRELHARAAALVPTRSSALEHRMAAAQQYDAALADEMDAYAAELYAQRSFRAAGQYLRWASGLTPDPAEREQRWLESVFALVVNFDFSPVEAELKDIQAAENWPWRALVLGAYAGQQRRHRDVVEHLEPIAATPLQSQEPRLRYRVEVLLAWARLCLGHPTEVIVAGLDRAASLKVEDAGVGGLEVINRSQMSIRQHGLGSIITQLDALPPAPAVPLPYTGALAFRGTLRTMMGLTREGSEDLTEATRRIVDGVTDLGAGSFHAQLGLAQWLVGDWGRSRVTFHQAVELGGGAVHQMTAALAPLVEIGQGRFGEADALIARGRAMLIESPYPEACLQFVGTLLARVHAEGSSAAQASALAELRGTPFEVTDITRVTPTVLLNYLPALIWAKRLDEADAAAGQFSHEELLAPWAGAASSWFRGARLRGARRRGRRVGTPELGPGRRPRPAALPGPSTGRPRPAGPPARSPGCRRIPEARRADL